MSMESVGSNMVAKERGERVGCRGVETTVMGRCHVHASPDGRPAVSRECDGVDEETFFDAND